MRYGATTVALAASIALAAPALAGESANGDALSRLEPQAFFQGMIRESDVTLLVDQLRLALLAAADGRDLPPSPALVERAAELRLRDTLSGVALLNAREDDVRARLRDTVPPPYRQHLPPPTNPVTPVGD